MSSSNVALMPNGYYKGEVSGLFRPAGLMWSGKVIDETKVLNRIAGRDVIEGKLSRGPRQGTVAIDYPRLGLRDVLWRRFAWDSTVWDGEMRVGSMVVKFTLTKEPTDVEVHL